MDGRTDGWTDGWMDGRMDERTDGLSDEFRKGSRRRSIYARLLLNFIRTNAVRVVFVEIGYITSLNDKG